VFALAPVGAGLASSVGDDCAHFVSYCIGSGPYVRGAGMNIPSRAGTYGEPGASRLVTTCLLAPGYAVEVPSLSQLSPGDVIGWTWASNDTNYADIGHVTLYMGNNLVTCHAVCALDVGANTFFGTSGWTRHLIHILDYPTINSWMAGNKFITSWGTNWNNYTLYSASSLSGPWNKVIGFHIVGNINIVTNLMGSGPVYYRLQMP
jgi:hypothetical protein